MVLRRLNASARYFSCTANILLICICRLDTECIYKLYAFITGSRSSPLIAACRVLDNISLSAALSLEAVIVMFLLFLLFLSPSSSSRLCSHLCQCYEHSDLVDCHARGLEDVPHGLPHGTWLLDLGGKQAQGDPEPSFYWPLVFAYTCALRQQHPGSSNTGKIIYSRGAQSVIYLPCKVSSSKYHLNQLFKGIVHLKNINIF